MALVELASLALVAIGTPGAISVAIDGVDTMTAALDGRSSVADERRRDGTIRAIHRALTNAQEANPDSAAINALLARITDRIER